LSQSEIDRLDGEISAKKRELSKAIEDGDTEAQIELNVALAEAIASKKAAQIQAPSDDDDDDVVTAEPDDVKQRQAQLVRSWTQSHDDWFGKPGFERETRMARRLDSEVFREGYEPHEDEYFEELDRRIREKAPHLFDSEESEDNDEDGASSGALKPEPRSRKDKRSAVAGVAPEGDKKTVRKDGNRVRITADDKRIMRNFNLDPRNPEHVREFALNKRQATRGES
jgi:hypothetical protein